MKTKMLFSFAVSMSMLICLAGLQGCQNKSGSKKETESKRASLQQPKKKARDTGYIYGKVKETMDAKGYTYMLLEFEGKDFWVAVPQMPVSVGEEVMLLPGDTMKNFHSNSLDRTFETIIFSQGPAAGGAATAHSGGKTMAKPHSGTPSLAKQDITVEPATGKDAITVQTAHEKAKELDGRQVVLKAQVVKVSKNILGKNWLHVQDGTGTEKDRNFDLTVTTLSAPAVGQLVLIKGMLHADRDIGAGYFYPVIIEDANVTILK